ncbi:hypothetical protein OY671_012758, partial [Metschnikowia pulcherrima]
MSAEAGSGWTVSEDESVPARHVVQSFADSRNSAEDAESAGGGIRFQRAAATESRDTVQASARQREDEAENRRKPAEPEMMSSMIAESQRQERYFASSAYIEAFQQKFGNDQRIAVSRAEASRQTGQTASSEQAYRASIGTAQAADG